MSIENYSRILKQAEPMQVLQVALGGGNPNQHPDFCEVLRATREEHGIIPSFTTNGRGLTGETLHAAKQFCGVVAVSAYSPYEETAEAVRSLVGYEIKTNIHFMLDSRSIDTAIQWLENPPTFLNGVNAVVFLNYKPAGRLVDHRRLLKHTDKVGVFFQLATSSRLSFKVGFDSCLTSGLAKFGDVPAVFYDGCDAGRFSMFVSEDMRAYPCSFMIDRYEGVPLEEDNMSEVWRHGNLFVDIRNRLHAGRGSVCKYGSLCLGGCPVFREITLCHETEGCYSREASLLGL